MHVTINISPLAGNCAGSIQPGIGRGKLHSVRSMSAGNMPGLYRGVTLIIFPAQPGMTRDVTLFKITFPASSGVP